MAPNGQMYQLLGYPTDARLVITNADDFGICHNDYGFLDSYSFDPVTKAALHAELLHALPVGLSEWAVHPGLDGSELLAIEPGGNHVRQTDSDFLMPQRAIDAVRDEGIILLDYRALQAVWKNVSS